MSLFDGGAKDWLKWAEKLNPGWKLQEGHYQTELVENNSQMDDRKLAQGGSNAWIFWIGFMPLVTLTVDEIIH